VILKKQELRVKNNSGERIIADIIQNIYFFMKYSADAFILTGRQKYQTADSG
jgi:hypothetical protein